MSKGLEIALMKAKSARKRGDLAEAEEHYAGILARFPNNARARKGMEELRQEQSGGAGTPPVQAAGTEPSPQEAQALIALYNEGRLDEAVERAEGLAARYPDVPLFWDLLAKANRQLQRLDAAADAFRRLVQIAPDHAESHYELGVTLQTLGRMEEAAASYGRVVALNPDHADAHHYLGVALQALARMDEHGEERLAMAISHHLRAVEIDPNHADAHFNLGKALLELGHTDESDRHFEHASAIRPGMAEAHNGLGMELYAMGKMEEAASCFRRAVRINPDYSEAWNNLALTLQALDQWAEAITCFERAIQIARDSPASRVKLGELFLSLGREEDAIGQLEPALQIAPDHAVARSQKLILQAQICDWDALAAQAHLIPTLGVEGSAAVPFSLLPFEDHPARHRIRAEKFASETFKPVPPLEPVRPETRPDRIRIGYFSADFHNHATTYLMARLFELHDRNRFSVHLFSYGASSTDVMRQRVRDAADSFHDVSGLGEEQIAERARREGIDIAIDLKGYTQGGRFGIFAARAAPIQISYLGYPGTLGADFIDYIVADKVVIPPEQRPHYVEHVIYLPGSYQVNDDRRAIADRTPTRQEMGLPEQGFVFCSFNNNYKISPAEFDIWMRLLQRVEGSVLWLFKGNSRAEENLRNEAKKRGVDPARLVFAEKMPLAEHLARHRLADLFLDTFNVNAHTTASDALWAGLPMLTRIGEGFVARVAASLLNAVGLPELVTQTAEEYESRALELALNPQRLAAIWEKLAANRLTAPLFDTEATTRHLEAAYEQVYDAWLADRPFGDIAVR